MARCTHNFYCDCAFHRKNREAVQSVTESNSGRSLRNTALEVTAAGLAVGGYIGASGMPPDTGMLADSQQAGIELNLSSIEEASHQQGTGTSQE